MGDKVVNLERENESEGCSGRGGIVMDTPERKQIGTPFSKFEDSPVFNYLNNLSPIQPVKSMHITQSFNSLSFASLPSVFTSPHVNSLKESRFLRRHQLSDPSKPEFSSENGNKVCRNEEVRDIEQPQNFDPGSSTGEASAEPPYESSLSIELSRITSYEFVNPDYDPITCCGRESKCTPDLTGSSTARVYVQSDSGKGSFGSEVNVGGMRQIDENKEASGCDWENLLSDTTDLLISDSPNDSKSLKDPSQKSLEPGMSFCSYLTDDLQNTGAVEAVGLSQLYETENTSSQPEDSGDKKEIAEDHDMLVSLSNCMAGDTSKKVDDELASNLHRGMRRRCLVFEMVGSRKKHLDDGSNCGPSMSAQSHDNIASSDKRLAPIKPGNDTRRCILPGIGLHLNALAATSLDQKVVKHEALATEGQPISVSHSAACLNSSNSEDITNNSLAVIASERDMLPAEGGVPIVEDAAQASGYMVNEEFNHSSPKKKRRRLENGGESEACKRCNCKKSKCLKLYCECFAAGVYCVEPCSCQECFNKPIHEDTVLATRKQIESRNPLAFAPKVIRSSDSIIEIGEESSKTPASARHKRGCNCKKSGCLKKYCECYQGGVGCSINCRCERCKNAFGRKDGSTSTGTGVELEEEQEVDEYERSVVDRSLQITKFQNDEEQNTTFALPATPLRFIRQSTQQPLSSKSNKPPRSSFVVIGSSSGLYGSQKFGKLNPPSQAKFEKHIQTARGDEMPEILQTNDSPISGVKSASPNSKRVSPPHCNIGSAPAQRSSRKLILQSIPSFPSLNP